MKIETGKWHFDIWRKTYCFENQKEIPQNPNVISYWVRVILSPFCAFFWFLEVWFIFPILHLFEFYMVQRFFKFLYWLLILLIIFIAFLKN